MSRRTKSWNVARRQLAKGYFRVCERYIFLSFCTKGVREVYIFYTSWYLRQYFDEVINWVSRCLYTTNRYWSTRLFPNPNQHPTTLTPTHLSLFPHSNSLLSTSTYSFSVVENMVMAFTEVAYDNRLRVCGLFVQKYCFREVQGYTGRAEYPRFHHLVYGRL